MEEICAHTSRSILVRPLVTFGSMHNIAQDIDVHRHHRSRVANDMQERICKYLDGLLILPYLCIGRLRRIKLEGDVRRKVVHLVEQGFDELTQVLVSMDLSKRAEKLYAHCVTSEERDVVCFGAVQSCKAFNIVRDSQVDFTSRSMRSFRRSSRDVRVSNRLSKTGMIISSSLGGHVSQMARTRNNFKFISVSFHIISMFRTDIATFHKLKEDNGVNLARRDN